MGGEEDIVIKKKMFNSKQTKIITVINKKNKDYI